MALKSTVFKVALQIADMDRGLYADHALTVARHPTEIDERLVVRLLAFALHVPADDHQGALQFTRGLSDADEPALWQPDLTGQLRHWIEVGQPDDRRLAKACGRSDRVSVYAFGSAVPIWWAALEGKVNKLRNLNVWQLPHLQVKELATLVERSMQFQVTVQEGQVWMGHGEHTVQVEPVALWPRQ